MLQSDIMVLPFSPDDLLYVEPRDEQRDDIFLARGHEYAKLVGKFLDDAAAKTVQGNKIAYTIMDADKILGCAGIYENFEGSGEAWAIFSKDIGRCKFLLYREILRNIKNYKFTRLQSSARADFKEAQKFLISAGFKKEARLKKATTDGKDLLIFSMVR